LVPGGTLLFSIAAFESFSRELATSRGIPIHTPVLTAAEHIHGAFSGNTWATELFVIAIALGLTYILGHVVASISAITIDRAYVAKAHGYPFRHFLNLGHHSDAATILVADYHRALFFWFNLYLVIRYLSLPGAVPLLDLLPSRIASRTLGALDPARLALFDDRLGWLLLTMTLVFLVSSTSKRKSPEWIRSFWASTFGKGVLSVVGMEFRFLAVGARRITHVLGDFLHTTDSLDVPTSKAFKTRLKRMLKFEDDLDLSSSSTYWYTALRVRSGPSSVAEPAENWLRLYGFARNLATAPLPFIPLLLFTLAGELSRPSYVDFE
jgi:hypothetical protein